MIDYFALLDQPRAPWLDPVELRNRYHEKTLTAHPDGRNRRGDATETDATLATLNEAYQTLQNPKRRLHHLLSLYDCPPSSAGQDIPQPLQDLFLDIGSLTQQAQILLQKSNATSNALSRSLMKSRMEETRSGIKEMRAKLQHLYDEAMSEMESINPAWRQDWPGQAEAVAKLYYVFAYLGRWIAQLDELAFQLSLN